MKRPTKRPETPIGLKEIIKRCRQHFIFDKQPQCKIDLICKYSTDVKRHHWEG